MWSSTLIYFALPYLEVFVGCWLHLIMLARAGMVLLFYGYGNLLVNWCNSSLALKSTYRLFYCNPLIVGMFGFRPNIATPNLRLATGILVGVWLTTKARLATARKPSRHTFFPRKFGGHFHRHTDLWRATAVKNSPTTTINSPSLNYSQIYHHPHLSSSPIHGCSPPRFHGRSSPAAMLVDLVISYLLL